MKILFYGDSITDMGRNRESAIGAVYGYGAGYVFLSVAGLERENPGKNVCINRGIGGNRIVDLYARVKCDVWNHNPDVLSILIGINDIWHDLYDSPNGVDIERFERIYRMLLADTKERLPDVKLMLLEPFVLEGTATKDKWETFNTKTREYAKVVKKLAEEFCAVFVPLQDKLDEAAAKYGAENFLYDGVHPAIGGAALISDEWLKAFRLNIK